MSWQKTALALEGFGGTPTTLYVRKTGLPYFDALRLYGAIDLVFRLSGETEVHDEGPHWTVKGRERTLNSSRMSRLIDEVRDEIRPKPVTTTTQLSADFSTNLRSASSLMPENSGTLHQAIRSFAGLDSALQSGVRGTAARKYDTLQSGFSSGDCVAGIALFDGLLAVAGSKRTHEAGDFVFLPVFEGKIDFSKIVSPLRLSLRTSFPVLTQAMMLLAVESALFSEGYSARLSAIVYNKPVTRTSYAYSGILDVNQTALSQDVIRPTLSCTTVTHFYAMFQNVCAKTRKGGKPTEFVQDALAMAYWILHPRVHKHLRSLITSQERQVKHGTFTQLFTNSDVVKEVFRMTHSNAKDISHEDCRKLAKAVALGIFHARMKQAKEPWKEWYNEVTLLRSATRAPLFFRRALILIEQGRRENKWVGSAIADQDYDPEKLESHFRQRDPREFEIFRDLFRMYLIQESCPRGTGKMDASAADIDIESIATDEEQEQAE